MTDLEIIDLGTQPYRPCLEYQQNLFDKMVSDVRAGIIPEKEYLLLVEHEPVYTMGRHAKQENLLVNYEYLGNQGIECVRISRGGDITYHGPGQLVAYPIIYLQKHNLCIKDYVDLLEESVIRTLEDLGIQSERVEGATGVWLGKSTPEERKICAIGIKSSRYVTMHGLALNVTTDLSKFNAINPCGFTDKGVTSIAKELARKGRKPDMKTVKSIFITKFNELLEKSGKEN